MKKIWYLRFFLFGFSFFMMSSFIFAQRGNSLAKEEIGDSGSWLVSFIERKLSTPNRQIRLHNIKGALSSQASIDTITVSDNKGIWLKIKNTKVDWNRLALLRGHVEINQLSAEKIIFLRKPQSSSSISFFAADQFSIPKLPIAIFVNTLMVDCVTFEKDIFGLASDVSLKGHLTLDSDEFDSNIEVQRLDESGYFSILTRISNNSRTAKIDIIADEPQNGIMANILELEKRPALNLTVKGNGTFDDLVVMLHLEANQQPILEGNFILTGVSEGHSLLTNLGGKIGLLMPAQYRSLFESNVALKAKTTMTNEGAMQLNHMTIQGDAIDVVANAEITNDGFLRRLFVDGKIAFDKGKSSTRLPRETKIHLNNLALTIDYGRKGQKTWKGRLAIHNLNNDNVHIRDAVFDMGGMSENLDNLVSRHVGIQINGTLQGIKSIKDGFAENLNQPVHIHFDTDILSGKPMLIHDFSITAQDFSIWLKGQMDRFIFKGDLGIQAQTLAPLGLLNGKSFSGSADIKARGSFNLIEGAFDLKLLSTTNNAKIGREAVDHFLKGKLLLSGDIAWNTMGLIIHDFHLKNQFADIKADGHFSRESAEIDFSAQISKLALLDPRMDGTLTIKGAARGHNSLITISTNAHIAEAFLVGKKLQNTILNVNALMDNTSPVASYLTGFIEGKGTFAEKPLQLSAAFDNTNHIWKFQGINIKGGNGSITGNIAQTFERFLKGNLHIDANDISTLSALFLQKGNGKVKGDFIFDEINNQQIANLKANVDHLILAKNEIKKLAIQADIFDPFGAIQFKGSFNAEHIRTPLMIINRLNAQAINNNGQTVFNVQASFHNNTNAKFSGRVIAERLSTGVKQKVQLETIDVKQANFHAALLKPATIIFDKNEITISKLGISINEGEIALAGNIQDTLNLHLTMSAVPANLANFWKSDLGAIGTLTGDIMICGSLIKPEIIYDVKGQDLTIASFQEKKIMPFAFSAKGKTVDQALLLYAELSGDGLQAQAEGKVPLDKSDFDLHVNLKNFPVRLINGFIKGQPLGGEVVGKVDIGGDWKSLSTHFELYSQNLTVMTHKGLESINMNILGSYKKSTFHIEHMIAFGAKELDLSVNGQISLNDSRAELNVKGTMPLTFMNQFIAERGANVTGTLKIDSTLSGALSKPQLGGHFSVSNGHFLDTQTNLELNNIRLEAKLNGDHMILEHAYASSFYGGSLSASGRIFNDLQTDLVIYLDHAHYNDGSMIFATLTGKMAVTGYFLRDLVIGGDIIVEKAELLIPDNFQNAAFLDFKHKNLIVPIQKTLERANVKNYNHNQNASEKSSSVVQLDIKINAHNKFFVRGRGVDAELGGSINLKGPLHGVHPVGELQMIRGRFDILSRRLNFDKGQASFNGNLNPTVYFITNSNNGDIRVNMIISGTINNLDIQFSSQPVLPQDEILARLIFNRSLNELSPFQIIQLTAAAAELFSTSNTSLLNTLRTRIGLDDLDVVVDKKGNTGLRVGRYIHDDIYLGFEAGSNGTTKGTINLDVSRHLKAKGAIGGEENTSFGLFYEKDY
ncbi:MULTISPECIES: translocation/assembly module TamB domain-containing protein [unclassified Bartonella]|uniref:translocation/assembly module TamB domain-containing protein n=1 Tax=unclassified Bartonella TaxID=2645622 RepID=UPI00099A5FCF|nr:MULTISPECIES: translocation/assembly module TamB domain-containing protein [unclassified Bartonella]AQX28637.1 autotransporter secretion inner membrane proteinTamB [Bartonella sp. JB15]AQX29893.1 autotransporter secretion inner membrane proteinTamB [Bartonella sp. JB63]